MFVFAAVFSAMLRTSASCRRIPGALMVPMNLTQVERAAGRSVGPVQVGGSGGVQPKNGCAVPGKSASSRWDAEREISLSRHAAHPVMAERSSC